MNKKSYALSEAAGCVAIYLAAVFLHFIYPLSGGSPLAFLFGAVNESVWEHVKIFSAAYTGYALLQLLWIHVPFRRYVVAKCAGLYLLMGGIILSHYTFIAIAGDSLFRFDILSSVVLVILAQLVSYRLTTGHGHIGEFFIPALWLLLLYYLMFFSFTIFPPKTALFRDPLTGGYANVSK